MATMNNVRPATPNATGAASSGHTSLGGGVCCKDEPLLFELGGWDKTGVDFDPPDHSAGDLGDLVRAAPIGLAALSEPETLRHYVRLAKRTTPSGAPGAPSAGLVPTSDRRLGEKMARLAGFADRHPLQPTSTTQGALELIDLAHWLKASKHARRRRRHAQAGAHGSSACSIRARRCRPRPPPPGPGALSAHGTNPATAAFVGYSVQEIAQTAGQRVDLADLESKLGPDVAAIFGHQPQHLRPLRARRDRDRARITHAHGRRYLRRGQLQRHRRTHPPWRPGRRRHMHINLHKTFSTPHGGGGPKPAPWSSPRPWPPSRRLPGSSMAPTAWRWSRRPRTRPRPSAGCALSRGQMGMFVRAYAYMRSHGSDGLRRAAEDAVLNANYIKARLSEEMTPAFPDGPCMHEALFDDTWLEGAGVTTLVVA